MKMTQNDRLLPAFLTAPEWAQRFVQMALVTTQSNHQNVSEQAYLDAMLSMRGQPDEAWERVNNMTKIAALRLALPADKTGIVQSAIDLFQLELDGNSPNTEERASLEQLAREATKEHAENHIFGIGPQSYATAAVVKALNGQLFDLSWIVHKAVGRELGTRPTFPIYKICNAFIAAIDETTQEAPK